MEPSDTISKTSKQDKIQSNNGRIHPCSQEEFNNLNEIIQETEDDSNGRQDHRQSLTGNGSKSHYSIGKYTNPNARDAISMNETMKMTFEEKIESIFGIIYLFFTISLSLFYVNHLTPAMSNDLWWAGFNASGGQSYLIDLFNGQLNLETNRSFDLTDIVYASPKDYSEFYTPIQVTPIYGRMLLLDASTNLPLMIKMLSEFGSPDRISTQYCWVDFNRRWEVAHTSLRQKRCNSRYTMNAAMYWEAPMRMITWNGWMKRMEKKFDQTIGNGLKKTVQGIEWLNKTINSFQSIENEIIYWKSFNLTIFELQYTNSVVWGVDEIIQLNNAFGSTQAISIKRISSESRGGKWTTDIMYWGPWNDYNVAMAYSYSYIRSDSENHRFTAPCNYTEYLLDPVNYACDPCSSDWNPEYYNCAPSFVSGSGLPYTLSKLITDYYIGPFNSIDLYNIAPPHSMVLMFQNFTLMTMTYMQSNEKFYNSMMNAISLPADPVPIDWIDSDFEYMGGDPTCPSRSGLNYVQTSFSFDVTCTKQDRNLLELDPYSVLFAMVMTEWENKSDIIDLCTNSCILYKSACIDSLTSTFNSYLIYRTIIKNKFQNLKNISKNEIIKNKIGIIQYASKYEYGYLLQQFLVNEPNQLWDLFGWIYIYDWLLARREVVLFDGDYASYTLISEKYNSITLQAQELEVPKSACQYLWVISVVVSTIITIVGILFIFYTILLNGRIVGRNLFQFNRIVGAVWLGRPFLLVRGMTAIILLSTSELEFQYQQGLTNFKFQPRTWFETMVVAGEATWITYVINDFLLLISRNSQPLFAPISTILGWIIYVIFDLVNPYQVTSAVDRQCTFDMAQRRISCTSGYVNVGERNRAIGLVSIQLGCIILSVIFLKLWIYFRRVLNVPYNGHLLLSGTATAFLKKEIHENGSWMVDRASCVMCGLITYQNKIFDLKLWLLVQDIKNKNIKWSMQLFEPPELNRILKKEKSKKINLINKKIKINRFFSFLGLMYMFSTIFGSVTYLTLTSTNMANDFWWANYNASREHIYLARLYNRELITRPQLGQVEINSPIFLDEGDFNQSLSIAVPVKMSPLYASRVQSSDGTDLGTVIRGLRNMDGCLAPWISTQYCWLDFNRNWEMANTAKRQVRCNENYTTNGANYLESILRNVNWIELNSCWKNSLEIGILNGINETENGINYWNKIQERIFSILEEINYWKLNGINKYQTDWQNYKSIGIIDTFNIKNAFGYSYSMTLKYSNSTYPLPSETSRKMYWSFASDLWYINTLKKFTLIRNNNNLFLFNNKSIENILYENGTLRDTLTFQSFRKIIGPFGSVDLKHILIPNSFIFFIQQVKDTITLLRYKSKLFSDKYSELYAYSSISLYPEPWKKNKMILTYGGNIMCDEIEPTYLSSGLYFLAGFGSACKSSLGEYFSPSITSRMVATIGTEFINISIPLNYTLICQQVTGIILSDCINKLISPFRPFLLNKTLIPDQTILPILNQYSKNALNDIQKLNIELFQYTKLYQDENMSMSRHDIFDPNYPNFHYLGWLLVYEWAMATREVISIQGDTSTIHIITSSMNEVTSLVNALEIPINVASYIRYACLYVTCIIICVAILATMYLFLNRGYVEGLNLFEINRVAGIVWIGRTILFVRGLAAICLLSTQILSLEPTNSLYHFISLKDIETDSTSDQIIRFFKTFLASSEVSWFGYVLNDIFMVFTEKYTTGYVFKCNFMIWGLSALLSLGFPTEHSASIRRNCEMPQVDFQLVCDNGTIAIGSMQRFVTLIGICIGSIGLCYGYERLRYPNLESTAQNSLFLAASAKYVYDPSKWIDHEVYYIDPSSAVINGILSFRIENTFYIFDLKIWRLFIIEEPIEKRKKLKENGDIHLLTAIPLTE